jgi:two-component system nitrogen regulation response regulator GlnG
MPEPRRQILVVDDEETVRWAVQKALEREGHTVLHAADGPGGAAAAEAPGVDLVLLDVRLPGMDGLEVLARLRRNCPELPVIMMTAHGTMQVAVEAMKGGAYDYIAKPFDMEELKLLVRKAFEARALTQEVVRLRAALEGRPDFGGIVGQSAGMQEVAKAVGRVAATDLTVLIRGESGTGKELIARAIHANSRRHQHPMVAVNCAAIPRELLESELFGHEKGAFTGAVAARRGRFEQADAGTLFLDEIGDMDVALQTKILRVLQERQVERLGGERLIPVDVRIIAATNQDLDAAVARRAFREDLFYRLNVVVIHVPPLRDRREDIPPLAEHFLKQFAAEQGGEPKVLSAEALEGLVQHRWPGNVRELENVVKRACVQSPTAMILPEHLPAFPAAPEGEGEMPREGIEARMGEGVRAELRRLHGAKDGALHDYFVSCLERPLLEAVLERAGGNQLKAAELLGINRNTLRKRIRELKVEPPRRGRGAAGEDEA